jgi:uncharacterized protein YjdB
MSYIFVGVTRIARRWGWLAVLPMLVVCSGGNPSGTIETPNPGAVADLAVGAAADVAVTLTFTQVDNGMGQPASYDVRYVAGAMSWGTATSAASGTCASPLSGTAVSGTLSCTILGLAPSTSYAFQVKAFRGTMGGNAVFGGLSNVASVSTLAGPPPPPVVTTVTVTPPSASIAVGTTTTLQATVKDQSGNPMSGQTVTWSTSNPGAATVNSSGVVSGVAAGSATITATSSGKSGTSAITVTAVAPVVTSVTVAPPSASIVAGTTTALQATVKDQNGNPMTGQTITWTTNNAAAATVNSSGVVSGVAAGSATITATSSGKSGTSAITVTAVAPVVTTVTVAPPSASILAGTTTTLVATVRDQLGNVMTGQTVTWSTNNAAAATVNSSGVVSGVAAGSATITATSSGKSGTSAITVTTVSGGGTILFQESFEDANLSSRSWYDNTSVLLSTTEHTGVGSTSSAQYHFLAGATTPTTGGAQRHKFTASNSVYISYNLKYTANWVGSNQLYHPHEIYVMSSMDGDFDGPSDAWMTLYLEHSYQNGGKPRLMMQDNKAVNSSLGTPPYNLVGVTENRSTGGCNGMAETNMASECFMQGYWFNDKSILGPVVLQPVPGPGYKNDWNFVEAYFQLNTVVGGIGLADGVMQYWFNGTLIIDRHDILYRTGARPNLQFNQFLIAPYIGDGSPVDQSMFIDNLTVATGRVP